MNKSILIKLCGLLFVLALFSEALEAKMYRYKNSEGKTVVNSILPPKFSQGGYEVLSDSGLVIEMVAPRKTAEQLREELINKATIIEEERIKREQEELDIILINSYTDISDIERARDNELVGKDRSAMLFKQNIRRLTRLLEDTQNRAARDERLGRVLTKELLDEISRYKKRITEEEDEVVKLEDDKLNISERYASSIIRFSELKATEQLRRYRPDDLASNDSMATIYQCSGVLQCSRAWQESLKYASEYSTTELAWANEVTIMMRKPRKPKDISIMVTRINNSNGKGSSLIMEVRCNKSPKGDDFCKSVAIDKIKEGFLTILK
ncbi:MAG: hypothetical protein ACI9N9_000661 [Enterobacterales bacterium]